MRKITANTFMTLDGVMQAPGGPEEDRSEDFKNGGWVVHYFDEKMGNALDEYMSRPFELLLGRKTYDIFASYWPFVSNHPIADKFNATKKYVVSRTLTQLNWSNSYLIKNDVVNEIAKLKEQDGPELQVHGSGNLIKTLINENLIDLFQVMIFPVTVGKGKQLFGEGTNAFNLKLIDCKQSSSGVIIATYQPAGELKTGTVTLDDESEEELKRRRETTS